MIKVWLGFDLDGDSYSYDEGVDLPIVPRVGEEVVLGENSAPEGYLEVELRVERVWYNAGDPVPALDCTVVRSYESNPLPAELATV